MNNETLDSIFITFSKNSYPFYSEIPHQIFTKLYTQLKIYQNDKNQMKNLLKHTLRVTSAIRAWCQLPHRKDCILHQFAKIQSLCIFGRMTNSFNLFSLPINWAYFLTVFTHQQQDHTSNSFLICFKRRISNSNNL